MKTKFSFEIMDLEDGLVAVPVGDKSSQFHGVLKVNETAADIIKLLEKDTTEDMIVETMLQEYDADKEQLTKYVHEFIATLKAEGIIE